MMRALSGGPAARCGVAAHRRRLALPADHADTPSARGYRMPAEWAAHEATWVSWPHNRDSWPGVFEGVEPAMVEFVRALAECEPVYVNVRGVEHERHVRTLHATTAPFS
jgi:agmatine/peptidylarginine deiminase